MQANRAELARFQRLMKQQANGCHMWTGQGTRDGYGLFQSSPGKPKIPSHRWSYLIFRGEIPEGMQVGHLCHDRAVADGSCAGGLDCVHRRCCNPEHLELQTPSENTFAQNHHARNRTECPKGHPYEGDNLIVGSDGKRRCRECDRDRKRKPK
jgi:hypothetical protein